MKYDEIVKKIISGEKIFNIPLRVCYYARVSTDSDVQLNSLDNQLNYYENYIKSKSNWTYVDGYVDEGISGVRVEKREAFKKMIRDAKRGLFDLIITKEVSRWGRDLEDSIHYVRELKSVNVGVYFENQNLNTFDPNCDLILNIMFNLAEEESRKLSSRIKFGHMESIKKGHVLGSSNIIGYRKDNCKLVIVQNEAEFIRKVFELYATGKYGFSKLSKYLGSIGYYNKNGNLYDKETLKRIISNPKYKGFYRGHTYETIDYRTKKRKKIIDSEQIIYKSEDGRIPTIVSEELWNRTNEILNKRMKMYIDNHNYIGSLKYPFSSKIICNEHKVCFERSHGRKGKNRPTWSCKRYLQYRLDACKSPIIAELDLYNIFLFIMNKIICKKKDIINELYRIYENIDYKTQFLKKLESIKKDISSIEAKKNLALDLVLSGNLQKEELIVQFANLKNELNKLEIQRDNILKQEINQNKNIKKLKQQIEEEINNSILEDFIRKFVKKINVFKIDNNRHNLKLDIYLEVHKDIRKDNLPYLLNQKYISVEKLRKDREKNIFIYNVYLQ